MRLYAVSVDTNEGPGGIAWFRLRRRASRFLNDLPADECGVLVRLKSKGRVEVLEEKLPSLAG